MGRGKKDSHLFLPTTCAATFWTMKKSLELLLTTANSPASLPSKKEVEC